MMNKEIWKDIPGYEGHYQVSNIGRVKSFKSIERILKNNPNKSGYIKVNLQPAISVHVLVAIAFLGHKPCGMLKVVDHINGIKHDNRVENLRIITHRDNCYTHYKGTSKYKGVSRGKTRKKWKSSIQINGKKIYLGSYNTELEAHNAYKNKLNTIL